MELDSINLLTLYYAFNRVDAKAKELDTTIRTALTDLR